MGLVAWGSCTIAPVPADKGSSAAPQDINGFLQKGVMTAGQGLGL